MTVLLEMKERLKLIYSKGEPFLLPLVKFLLAFITFNTLNGRIGYMTQLNNVAVVLIVALTCSFLPVGAMVFFAAVFSLVHMYTLSMEVALVGGCVYLVMYLLFFRFSPGDSLVVVLTPLMCVWKIPYVVPIVVGLLCGPASAVSVGCGVVVYYLVEAVIGSASNINTMGDEEIVGKIRIVIEALVSDKAMLVVIAAFAVTILVVYFLRRMSIDYSWTIAMIAGVMINVVILLIGDLLYDINISVGGALLGSLLAIVIAKIVEFFRFCVDYSRVEKVQFEDDEYYYYVKAVPKMAVSVSTKTVKKINSQQTRAAGGRGSASRHTGRINQPARSEERNGADRGAAGERGASRRAVSGERVSTGRDTAGERQTMARGRGGTGRGQRNPAYPQSRSNVTIGSTVRQDTVRNVREDAPEDFEELF